MTSRTGILPTMSPPCPKRDRACNDPVVAVWRPATRSRRHRATWDQQVSRTSTVPKRSSRSDDAGRAARTRAAGPAPADEDESQTICGAARFELGLAPTEPDGQQCVESSSVEVPVHVVPPPGAVVPQEPVEL